LTKERGFSLRRRFISVIRFTSSFKISAKTIVTIKSTLSN